MKTKFAELHEQLQHSEGEKPNPIFIQQLANEDGRWADKSRRVYQRLRQHIQKMKHLNDDQCAYEQQVHNYMCSASTLNCVPNYPCFNFTVIIVWRMFEYVRQRVLQIVRVLSGVWYAVAFCKPKLSLTILWLSTAACDLLVAWSVLDRYYATSCFWNIERSWLGWNWVISDLGSALVTIALFSPFPFMFYIIYSRITQYVLFRVPPIRVYHYKLVISE